MALLAAEVGDVARAGREAREEGIHLRDISVSPFPIPSSFSILLAPHCKTQLIALKCSYDNFYFLSYCFLFFYYFRVLGVHLKKIFIFLI